MRSVTVVWIGIVIVSGGVARGEDGPVEDPMDALEVEPPEDEGEPPEPRKRTGTFAIGAGYDADDGFVAQAEARQDDLFGSGQKLALSARLSERGQDFRVRYETAPTLGGLTLAAELFDQQTRFPGLTRDGRGGALTATRSLGRATRAWLRYGVEEVRVDADLRAARELASGASMAPLRIGDGTRVTLGGGVAYDTRDAAVLPTRGTRLALQADVADRWLGSDTSMVTVGGALDHARRLGPFVLRVGARAALVRGIGGAVPLASRLQHDGHDELRGYGLGSLGARSTMDGAFAIGSDLEAMGRAELELPISRRYGVSIAGFADAGVRYNADPTWGPVGAEVARSVGVSILWRSPIGVLRFDWAVPLDGRDRGEPQFLFGLGSAF